MTKLTGDDMRQRHRFRALAAVLLGGVLVACGGDGDEGPGSGAATEVPAADDPIASTTAPRSEDAAVPTDCSEVTTDALAEAWSGEPILDTEDSHYEPPIEELRCEWYSDAQASEQITVQLSIESNYIGYYSSQEATAAGEYTTVEGFDDGRLYEDDRLMLGKRNGFVVAVDASGAESVTDEQMVAVALELTPPA
jgi:hypothetical protein